MQALNVPPGLEALLQVGRFCLPLGMGPPSLGMEPLHLLLAMELLDPQWEETKCRP